MIQLLVLPNSFFFIIITNVYFVGTSETQEHGGLLILTPQPVILKTAFSSGFLALLFVQRRTCRIALQLKTTNSYISRFGAL